MNEYFERYAAIMNHLDDCALNGQTADEDMLNELATADGQTVAEYIADLAEANDLGECASWTDAINALREQFEIGERV